MKRSFPLFTCLLLAILTAGPAALAQTPDEAAAAARDRGSYIDPALDRDEGRISDVIATASENGVRFFLVLLDEDPPGGAGTFAGAVLDRLGDGTVLVLSESDAGMESTVFSGSEMEAALDEAFDRAYDDESFAAIVVGTLTSPGTGSAGEDASDGGSSAGWIILVVVVGLLVLVVWWAIRRQKRSAAQSEERMTEEARKEIRSQLDAMANTILEISDQVSASETRKDNEYLEQAGATYGSAMEEFEKALDLRSLEALSDRLDEARWQLDAASALLHGRPIPPKPEKEVRHQCFFDPNHPEATEIAELRTSAGVKQVRVCQADAERLRRGEQPKPRMIKVAGRRVPAPMAPRSHGGLGLGWLDVFSVVLGGMAQRKSYDWGRTTRGGGIFGGGGSPRPSQPARPKRSRASRRGRRRR